MELPEHNLLNKHLQPSGHNSDFLGRGLSFADYTQRVHDVVSQTRLDLTAENAEKIILANTPQEAVPTQSNGVGILLVHGLLDSTLIMQSLFAAFASESYLVRSMLLPGHGTVPGDLLMTSHRAWREALRYNLAAMRQHVDKVVVVGYSTGATLALLEAAEVGDIDAIVGLAPAVTIKNPFACLTGFTTAVGGFFPSMAWMHVCTENDYAKYRSVPYQSVYQVLQLTRQLKRLVMRNSITCPLFLVSTVDDEVVSHRAIVNLFEQLDNDASRLLVYGNKPQPHNDKRVTCRVSAYPTDNILDFSHVSLVASREHSHYGINGDYQDFGHYETWWGSCLPSARMTTVAMGSLSSDNLRHYRMQRLTFNPDFSPMLADVMTFLSAVDC